MYDFKQIEKKWQERWEKGGANRAEDFSKKPKKYILDMFPYPSAQGLHVGHPVGYIASDILTRYYRMNGYNVLHPMGWDAFGLPAENYAIKTGRHPRITTEENIARIKKQIKSFGFAYDWSREINTTDPEYYKWTQWIFLQMWKKGLAYEDIVPINWCPKDKTGLANEEVIDGKCERCGTPVEKKDMRQWMLRITKYADCLLHDLESLDWPEKIKEMQRNWIGKSEGAEINFKVIKTSESPRTHKTKEKLEIKYKELDIPVFTTRLDTIFGVTAIVLAPEHPLVPRLVAPEYEKDAFKYIAKVKKRTEIDRTSEENEKTGVPLGVAAVNPFTGEEVPVWIADYVLSGYGTGAVMMVPSHDSRDFAFAKKYGLDIREAVAPVEIDAGIKMMQAAYTDDGILVNSGEFNGLISRDARVKLADFAEAKKFGRRQINYHLRDWVFSRQRYWGEPIPLVYCKKCGIQPVPENELPLKLPEVEKYEPTGTGESPLANIKNWVNTKCPKCGGRARRETNTMPQWAGSCWYYLRYCDPKNNQSFAGKAALKYWLPVDIYIGGAEHAVLHLLYSRFWHKFLYDIGAVKEKEPFAKLKNQGLILGEDGIKMSKSRGNVVNPDDIINEYGADTLRVYEMFMGPFDEAKPWETKSIIGVKRFLDKIYNLSAIASPKGVAIPSSPSVIPVLPSVIPVLPSVIPAKAGIQSSTEKLLHKTIKGVTEDIENFKFNTAISKLMIFVNEFSAVIASPVIGARQSREYLVDFLKLLSPFAPHLAEELWANLGGKNSTFKESWPKYDPKLAKDDEFELVIQVNGKVRDKIMVSAGISESDATALALVSEKIKAHTDGKEIKKIIFTGKLLNVVV